MFRASSCRRLLRDDLHTATPDLRLYPGDDIAGANEVRPTWSGIGQLAMANGAAQRRRLQADERSGFFKI